MASTRVIPVTMDTDHTVEAQGKAVTPPPVEHILTCVATNGCTIAPEGANSIPEGEIVNVTIGSLEGFEIDKVFVDGVEV